MRDLIIILATAATIGAIVSAAYLIPTTERLSALLGLGIGLALVLAVFIAAKRRGEI